MRRVAVLVLAWVAVLLADHAVAQSSSCQREDVARKGASVEAARKALQAVPRDDAPESLVSPRAQGLIAALKDRLAEFVAAYMACAPANAGAEAIKRDLADLSVAPSKQNRMQAEDHEWWYGGDLTFDVRLLNDAVPLIGVTASFAIECGNDALLAIYARERDAWVEVLRHRSPPYDEITGAFTAFDYAVSPLDAERKWYVVATHIPAWCTSAWRSVRYSLLRPAEAGIAPREVFRGKDPVWLGQDNVADLELRVGEFELTFLSWSIDMGVHNRVWVRRFAIEGDRVRRIDPVALTPRDFVDEWIRMPWEAATAWSLGNQIELQRLHRKLHDVYGFEYVSVRACSDAADQMQVEIAREEEQATYYFRVSSNGPAHRMLAIALEAQPTCDGPDLLESMATR